MHYPSFKCSALYNIDVENIFNICYQSLSTMFIQHWWYCMHHVKLHRHFMHVIHNTWVRDGDMSPIMYLDFIWKTSHLPAEEEAMNSFLHFQLYTNANITLLPHYKKKYLKKSIRHHYHRSPSTWTAQSGKPLPCCQAFWNISNDLNYCLMWRDGHHNHGWSSTGQSAPSRSVSK